MSLAKRYYITKIKETLSLKQRQNPHYSLRAYARDLGVHPATMSQILKGNRPLPFKNSNQVVERLKLGPKERTLFMESLLKSKVNLDQIPIEALDNRFMLDESYHAIIAEWEHFAALELFQLKDFKPTFKEFARRLDLSKTRTEIVLGNLMTCRLITQNKDGTFEKTHSDVRTTEDIQSNALKESHRETLKMSLDKLDDIEVELRDFSSSTLAIDPQKLPEAKSIIREFRNKMAVLLRDGEKTDVYQLAIQFYPLIPLTKKRKEQ